MLIAQLIAGRRPRLRHEDAIEAAALTDMMQKTPLDPDVADSAPDGATLTSYDERHVITYLRLLQAEGEGG